MDAVPVDFSERVAAACNCCYSCLWVIPVFPNQKWTFPNATNATFVVFPDASGEWRYNFHLESRIEMDMTLSELLQHSDFKNLQIDWIIIGGASGKPSDVSDVGMEKLLNFVSFLANEPSVCIGCKTSLFDSPEGAMLLSWLEERWFQRISFWSFHSVYKRLLQKQFSRRIPTDILIAGPDGDTAFFADHLRSGQMTWLNAICTTFSFDVMQGVIQSFLRSPRKKQLDIYAGFDDSTEGHLMEMAERGLCGRVGRKFVFENPFHRLEVSNPYNSAWRCVTMKSEFGLSASVVPRQSSALNGWKVKTWLLRIMRTLRQKLLWRKSFKSLNNSR